jgi:hypothetical protein
MPRLHYVKKARKDNPAVKAGEPYYWWKHAWSAKQYSKTRPRASQLTQSEFMSEYLSMGEDFEDALNGTDTVEDVQSAVDDLKDRIEQLIDETQGKLDNMPEPLQEGETGQMMQERIDGLEAWADELDGVDFEDFEYDPDDGIPEDEARGEWLTEKCGELTGMDPGLY